MIQAHLVKFVGGPNDGHTSMIHAPVQQGVPEAISVVLPQEGSYGVTFKRGVYRRSPLGDFFSWRGWEED